MNKEIDDQYYQERIIEGLLEMWLRGGSQSLNDGYVETELLHEKTKSKPDKRFIKIHEEALKRFKEN